MAIQAIALLRIPGFELPSGHALRLKRLNDAVLLYTAAGFGSEPDTLSRIVREIVGDALDQHKDERGIFFIPDVAAPVAGDYASVIAEVGEGGMWGPLATQGNVPGFAGGAGLEGALGSMLAGLPSGMLDSITQAAMSGDMAALQQAGAGLQGLMQGNPQLAGLLGQLESQPASQASSQGTEAMLARLGVTAQSPALASMLRGSGVDIDSPAFAGLLAQVQAQLESDPGALMSLAEQFLGAAQRADSTAPDEDEDKP